MVLPPLELEQKMQQQSKQSPGSSVEIHRYILEFRKYPNGMMTFHKMYPVKGNAATSLYKKAANNNKRKQITQTIKSDVKELNIFDSITS